MMRGQQMTVFKLLIGAVFAVALLAIVQSVISNIGCPYTGFEEVRNLVLQASRAPGKCFQRESMCFDSGSIIDRQALEANLPGVNNIYLSSVGNLKSFKCVSNTCTFNQKINIPVKVVCSSVSCTVTFNSLC